MSTHPNDGLLFRYLNAEPSAEDRDHLRACAICRAECERFESAIGGFRGSIRKWSEFEYAEIPEHEVTRSGSIPGGAWIMAFLILLALTGWKAALDNNPVGSPPTPDRDVALLNYVDHDVARAVPSGLEPLLSLVAIPDERSGEPPR